MKVSEIYFGGGGKYQKEYDELYDEIEPIWDEAEDYCDKVFISACNIYYENYNNGNRNVVLDGKMNDSFANDLDNLTTFFSTRNNRDAVDIIKKIYHIYVWDKDYNEDNDETYERLIDLTMEHLLEEYKK